MGNDVYSTNLETPAVSDGLGRGCIVLLVVVLVLLLLCCCLVVGLTGLYYVSPEFNDLISNLIGSLAG